MVANDTRGDSTLIQYHQSLCFRCLSSMVRNGFSNHPSNNEAI